MHARVPRRTRPALSTGVPRVERGGRPLPCGEPRLGVQEIGIVAVGPAEVLAPEA
jgi:hypothetical protein